MIRQTTHTVAATLMLTGLFLATPVLAFNPQPEPPAKTKLNQASHPAAFDVFLPSGQKQRAFLRGNQLILIGLRGGTAPAPDGQYRGPKGGIIVQGGLIVQGGRVGPGSTKTLKQAPSKQGTALPAVQ